MADEDKIKEVEDVDVVKQIPTHGDASVDERGTGSKKRLRDADGKRTRPLA